MIKQYAMAVILVFSIVLSGCQNKALEEGTNDMKIIEDGTQKADAITDKDIENEFDDNLDQALTELEETENI